MFFAKQPQMNVFVFPGYCRWWRCVQCSPSVEEVGDFKQVSVCCYGAHGGGAAAYSICVALNFFRAKDLTGLNLFDSCLKVLKSRMESEEPEKEVCGDCVAHLGVGRRFYRFHTAPDWAFVLFCLVLVDLELKSGFLSHNIHKKNNSQQCILFAAHCAGSEVCRLSLDVGQTECCELHIHTGIYPVLLVHLNLYKVNWPKKKKNFSVWS